MKDAVAYMAWERVVPWKILSMMARPDEPSVPLGFGARNRDFNELLEPGSLYLGRHKNRKRVFDSRTRGGPGYPRSELHPSKKAA